MRTEKKDQKSAEGELGEVRGTKSEVESFGESAKVKAKGEIT